MENKTIPDKSDKSDKLTKARNEFIQNMLAWSIYFVITMILLYPVFTDEIWMHISISTIISFVLGMFNKIIQLLICIDNKIDPK